MHRRLGIKFCSIFFLAMFIIECYCMLEYRNDYIMITGVSIAFLLSAYLLLLLMLEKLKLFVQQATISKEYYEEAERLQKATYVAIKKMEVVVDERMEHMESINVSCIDELIACLKETVLPIEKHNEQLNQNIQTLLAETEALIKAICNVTENISGSVDRLPK